MQNTINEWGNRYYWDSVISVYHSNGTVFSVQLWKLRDTATFVWYTCTSCGQHTTLAGWNCWSCWSPFEIKDLNEAKSLFPTVSVRENNPDRVAFLILHRAWVCMSCNSYNVNYPRTWDHSHISCINCGDSYKTWESILLEDGEFVLEWEDPVKNFQEKILGIIEGKKKSPAVSRVWNPPTPPFPYPSSSANSSPIPQTPKELYQTIATPEKRNKVAIVSWILGAGFISWLVYHGMIQEIDQKIQILWHSWERVIPVEKYIRQSWEDWEKNVNTQNLDEFVLVSRVNKEANWDPYEVEIWTKSVTDYSNCISSKLSCSSSKVTLSGGIVVDGPESCTTTCDAYGTKPVPIMEKRYHKHPYIEYTYMWWKLTDTLITTGTDKKPHWHNWGNYTFDGKHVREGARKEKYVVHLVNSDNKWENLQVPYPSWQALNEWMYCNVKATRWLWVKTSSLVDSIANCKKTDF